MGVGEEPRWGWVRNWDKGGSGIGMRIGSGSGVGSGSGMDTGQDLTNGWVRNGDKVGSGTMMGTGSRSGMGMSEELGWERVRIQPQPQHGPGQGTEFAPALPWSSRAWWHWGWSRCVPAPAR